MAFDFKKEYKELYLSDAGRVAPEKWKTVIRHPIKPKKSLLRKII